MRQVVVHKADQPDVLADLGHADLLAGKHRTRRRPCSQVVRPEARVASDSSQHLGADFLAVVKGEDVVRISSSF